MSRTPQDGAARRRTAAALLLGAVLVGCAPLPPRPAALASRPPVELAATPFHPQRELQCGPAALATVLGAAGRAIEPDALTPRLFIPGRGGSLQPEMLAQARREGFIALPIAPDPVALVAELDAGRPVVVLQNNGLSWAPRWHYAVVIGYEPAHDRFILRSGVTERLGVSRRTFEATWRRSGRWGFVLLPPGTPPAQGDGMEYARAVAAFEATGGAPADANAAWRAGAVRWPGRWELAFGLGNRLLADGDPAAAAIELARATTLAPERAAPWNNLAVALMALARWDEAMAAAETAVSREDSPATRATRAEARCRGAADCR